jgi:hypothetical protein
MSSPALAILETRDPQSPVRPEEFTALVRVVAQMQDAIGRAVDRNRDDLVDTVQFVNQLQERLQIVDVLPTSAPFGAIIRLNTGPAAGRIPLYIGNGDSQPLSKIIPVAL